MVASEMKALSSSCEEAATDSISNKEEISVAIADLLKRATQLKELDLPIKTVSNVSMSDVRRKAHHKRTPKENFSIRKQKGDLIFKSPFYTFPNYSGSSHQTFAFRTLRVLFRHSYHFSLFCWFV